MTKQSVLDKATTHFRNRIGGDLKSIEVPEWDSKLYFKASMTLREQSKLIELSQQGKTVEALVETLIVKARNQDGTKMFNIADKAVFMNEVDPNVLIRVVGEMSMAADDIASIEDAEKN
jgi:hypothetical protein